MIGEKVTNRNLFANLKPKYIYATLVIVLMSIIVRKYGNILINMRDNIPYTAYNEDFLELVTETYDDYDLVEWEPAPPSISKPHEPGDLGAAVVVPPEKVEEAEKRFKEQEFNVVANEMMSVNRTLADSRHPDCMKITYPKKLPQASVVIVYHNEAWSTLTRTIWSIIRQSPRALLKEIVLIDDFSTKEYLGKQLEDYVKTVPVRVVIAKTLSRVGLVQARLLGATKSTGKVLVFLDAHCECNQGWLEPLLDGIAKKRTSVVVPLIDIIGDTDMFYNTRTTHTRGVFNVDLHFLWDYIPENTLDSTEKSETAFMKTPTIAGGLFAIDKEFFFNIGSYDENMLIWGGENIEMSFRIWMCGGQLITAPCSRVGHIFRKRIPYDCPGGTGHHIYRNTARLVDVWLDDYKYLYYSVNPDAAKKRTNITERKELRKRLKCKSFEWYLQNVYPESIYNMKNYTVCEIESIGKKNFCVDTMGRKENEAMAAIPCHRLGGNQQFLLTDKHEIREKKLCADAVPGKSVMLNVCHGSGGHQKWIYDDMTKEIRNSNGTNCLTLHKQSEELTVEKCYGSPYQKWQLNIPKINLDVENSI